MTYMSGILSLLAVALVAALLVRTVRRDRALRRDAPGALRREG